MRHKHMLGIKLVLLPILITNCQLEPEADFWYMSQQMLSTSFQLAIAEEKMPDASQFLGRDTIFVVTPKLSASRINNYHSPEERFEGEDIWLNSNLPKHIDMWIIAPVQINEIDSLASLKGLKSYITVFKVREKKDAWIYFILSPVLGDGDSVMDRGRMNFHFKIMGGRWRLKRSYHWWG